MHDMQRPVLEHSCGARRFVSSARSYHDVVTRRSSVSR
jgi:hypothetical protein